MIQVKENDPALLDDFIRLNEAWIIEHFELEEADRSLAANPFKIIRDGGYIFSIVSEETTVLGVCALFNNGSGIFELARMAVDPNVRGSGYGSLLIDTCFSKLKALRANNVYLISNTKLKAAISLYKKHGFQTTYTGQHPTYARANIVMEANLTDR